MNLLAKLSVCLTICCIVKGQQESCIAVNGSKGTCRSLYNCQPLLAIINKPDRTQEDLDLLKKSHCGFDGKDPAVCCPAQVEAKPTPSQCYTPEGKAGQCISLYSCPNLANLLKPPVPEEKIQYVQRSKCTGPDQYSVCCGPVPDFTAVQKGKCASRVTAFPPDPKSECCGFDSNSANKIYGGLPTTVDQYPWLAMIEYKKGDVIKLLCGGALISGKYVLTAGHCVVGQVLAIGTPTSVRLAEYNTTSEGPDCAPTEGGGIDCTEGELSIAIEKIIPHPQYNPANAQRRNDIALLRLAQMAPFTDFIRPICLPTQDVTLKTEAFNLTASGWGAVSIQQSHSAIKLHVQIPFVSQDQCQPAYTTPGRKVTLWKGQICAGGEKGKDSCKGDSGGPLMYENGNIYEAVGVVSFGPTPCGLENIPGVYTNVYEYDTWIRSNIVP